jgi:hypothetical protein
MALINHRSHFFALALMLGLLASSATAPAAVDMTTGIRYTFADGTMAQCGTKAAAALNAYLQNATETPPGSGDWIATGPIGVNGPQAVTASGTVHCYPSPSGSGYVVTFSCAVQTPENPYRAGPLCLDIAHNFSGEPQTPLPTPSPAPTGCTTANLVGTWQSNNSSLSFTMGPDGSLTGSDGVSGSWSLYHNTATITYYGNHTMTLSPDGKHLNGGGYNLTRKC